MPRQYDKRIFILGRYDLSNSVRSDWNPERYEQIIALLLDRIFQNNVGKLLRDQIAQLIWIIPYTGSYPFWWEDKNAISGVGLPLNHEVDYALYHTNTNLVCGLSGGGMARVGSETGRAPGPRGLNCSSLKIWPKNDDPVVQFTPALFEPSDSCRDCADPSERRDEVLFHELVHSVRYSRIRHGLITDSTPKGYLKRTKMDDFEEFCAILVTNYYIMARGVGELRRNHHGFRPIRSPGYWTHRWRHATARFCEQQADFARALIPFARPEYRYDPIGEYFAKH